MRIFFLGDSFVNGACDPEYLGWAGRLCHKSAAGGLDITLYNLGIRGNTSADIRERWEEEMRRRAVGEEERRLVFSFGVNDTVFQDGKLRVEPEMSLANAKDILERAVKLCPVLFIGPPPIPDEEQNKRIRACADGLQGLCGTYDIPFFDSFTALIESELWFQETSRNDGAHPRAGGYTLWAEAIYNSGLWAEFLRSS